MSVKLIHTSVTCATVRLIQRYECEAHSHLSYYCYVMGVKLIHILNYECECVRITALYFIHVHLCGDG